MEQLLFSLHHDGAVLVLALHGDVDFACQDVLAAADRALAAHHGGVRVDLPDVPFMDSTGIHFLMAAHRRCAGHGVPFSVTRVGEYTERAVECGLLDLFTITPAVLDALVARAEAARAGPA